MDRSQSQAPKPNSSTQDALTHASQSLAAYFSGVVITDVELGWAAEPLPLAAIAPDNCCAEPVPDGQPAPDPIASFPQTPAASIEPDAALRVSLNQLRHWYAIARLLGRSDRLVRIAQLGSQFKQTFGDADPDRRYAFTAWSEKEVEWWFADLADYQQAPPAWNPESGEIASYAG